MFNEKIKKIDIDGKILELSTGKLARNTNASVVVKMGNSLILCTVVISEEPLENIDFLPLTVNYQEKTYAAGKIPGGYFKKEGKSTEREVLTSRLIDRAIRPLLKNFCHEIQVICTVHSYDSRYNPDILSMIGASTALALTGIKFNPFSALRVGMIDKKFVINPSTTEITKSTLDIVMACCDDTVVMLESESQFLMSENILDAIKFGQDYSKKIRNAIKEFSQECISQEKVNFEYTKTIDLQSPEKQALKEKLDNLLAEKIEKNFITKNKNDKYVFLKKYFEFAKDELKKENIEYDEKEIELLVLQIRKERIRELILQKEMRIDQRKGDEIRQLYSEVNILPTAHGSALFTRGETQVLASVTLGTGTDSQFVSSLDPEYKEHFLMEYIFPPYSTSDIAGLRAPSRREIGHGKLAWKSLKYTLPSKEEFSYTIRVVSEITESNGSSSMATVCGASMALMNAGVPIKKPISGIAMGLIKKSDSEYIILSDIIADEDHIGDMDFKISGTDDGEITALQMDLKTEGINIDLIEKIIIQAQKGLKFISKHTGEVISEVGKLKSTVPFIQILNIPQEKISKIIGPRGKTIKEISLKTETNIDISEDNLVSISGPTKQKVEDAIAQINSIILEPKIGQILEGVVVKIIDSGAFIDYSASSDGFIHISEISHRRIESVDEVLSEGKKVKVKVIDLDNKGKIRFSIKNLDSDLSDLPNERNEKSSFFREKKRSSSNFTKKPFPTNKKRFVNGNRRNSSYDNPQYRKPVTRSSSDEKISSDKKYFS